MSMNKTFSASLYLSLFVRFICELKPQKFDETAYLSNDNECIKAHGTFLQLFSVRWSSQKMVESVASTQCQRFWLSFSRKKKSREISKKNIVESISSLHNRPHFFSVKTNVGGEIQIFGRRIISQELLLHDLVGTLLSVTCIPYAWSFRIPSKHKRCSPHLVDASKGDWSMTLT